MLLNRSMATISSDYRTSFTVIWALQAAKGALKANPNVTVPWVVALGWTQQCLEWMQVQFARPPPGKLSGPLSSTSHAGVSQIWGPVLGSCSGVPLKNAPGVLGELGRTRISRNRNASCFRSSCQ